MNNTAKGKDRVVWCDKGWMSLCYGFCPNEKAWNYEMKRLGIKPLPPYPTSDAAVHHFENAGEHRACVIVTMTAEAKTGTEKVGMLVHEAMHVWRAMKEEIGETHPSSEFEAYSMQCVTQSLIEAFEITRGKLCHRRAR